MENKEEKITAPKPEKKKSGGLKQLLKSRRLRHGSAAAAVTAVVIAVVILINVIVGLLIDRFPNLKIDFTANQAYALQTDTEEYMANLKKDVTLYILAPESGFLSNGEYFVQAKNLLDKMEKASNGRLKVVYKDTSTDPGFAKKYSDIDWKSTKNLAVIECGDQYKALSHDECFTYDEQYYQYYGTYDYKSTTIEQAVVTGALNVTADDKVIVDVLKDNEPGDYTGVTDLLRNNAYQVNEISLITDDIDKDARFLLLFAPSVDLDQNQVDKIDKWLDNGGKYGRNLIYVASSEYVKTPNIDSLLNDWGMALEGGYVFETDPNHLQNGANAYTFISDYTDEYKDTLKNPNIPVLVNFAHGINIKDSAKATSLLSTSDRAGVEPYEHDDDWDYNEAVKGEAIPIAAQSVKATTEATSRLILFSSDRMLNKALMQYNSFNNASFVMNIFNTISDKSDDAVVIEGKTIENAELGITDVTSTTAVFVIFVIVIPLSIIVLGIVLWILRRNR